MTFGLALTGTLLLAGIGYFGWRKPAYSHWQYTISVLGEVGSPLSRLISYGLFLPVGLLLGLVAILTDSPSVAGLSGCVGTGYIVAAFFPCDVGSTLSGSVRQQTHNAGGAVEYVGGAYWLTQISPQWIMLDYNLYAVETGSLIVGSILLSIPGLPLLGLVQRLLKEILLGSYCSLYR